MADPLKDILLRHQRWEDEVEQQHQARQQSPACITRKASLDKKRCDIAPVAVDDTLLPRGSDTAGGFQRSHMTTDNGGSTNALTVSEEAPPKACYATQSSRDGNTALPANSSQQSHQEDLRGLQSTAVLSAGTVRSDPPSRPVLTAFDLIGTSPTEESSSSTTTAPSPPSPSLAASATFALPFTPYPVQQEMSNMIANVLHSSSPCVVPVAVAEVPTGCGKTMALLSSVLQYQQQLKRKSPHELELYLRSRRPPWQQPRPPEEKRKASPKGRGISRGPRQRAVALASPCVDEEKVADKSDDCWSVPPCFFKHFRVSSDRKIRAELDVTGSQALRRRFLPPPCTVYYVTRTHAQLRQAVRELRRLHGVKSAIRMNILGSRERYCIHPKVLQAQASRTLPVEGNNLGEVCDKLVSMGLCEMVDKYDELSCSAIAGPIGHQRGQVWDMEDLVSEGTSRHMCPYYAARDLVFFADINFCTYPYLLDPLIRHETKMEAALKNNAIVVFDEAHNVAPVCQDALSLECPRGVLALILSELDPLASNQVTRATQAVRAASSTTPAAEGTAAIMQYPRDLYLGSFTLAEIFSFLCVLFRSLSVFVDAKAEAMSHRDRRGWKRCRDDAKRSDDEPHGGDSGAPYWQGGELNRHLRRDMEVYVTRQQQSTSTPRRLATTTPSLASLELFQRAYGVIMALGVTFNPFLFSIFGLSMLKRWLLLLRFLFQKPQSFAVALRLPVSPDGSVAAPPCDSDTHRSLLGDFSAAAEAPSRSLTGSGVGHTHVTAAPGTIELRCLDGSLAFAHLLRTVHRVILASGTLSPFTQLARDLGVEASLWRTVEGQHVVPSTQYNIAVLSTLPGLPLSSRGVRTTTKAPCLPLRCTYTSLSDPVFLKSVAQAVVQLTQTLRESGGGGVLFFVPNYSVLASLAKLTREVFLAAQQDTSVSVAAPVQLFLEPRNAEALTGVLSHFQACTQAPRFGTALFLSVYRGKVSEGLDFTDDMARLVICLGVPLQPLKSWKVIAQRAYSGPEWYVTDAVRAVNQALGRCLRHVKDYGAVVLLDERYAQLDYQQRLSKWCRATTQTDMTLPQLCEQLRMSFTQWRGALRTHASGSVASQTPSTSAAHAEPRNGLAVVAPQDPTNLARALLGTEKLPFTRVQRTLPAFPQSHRIAVEGSGTAATELPLHESGATCSMRQTPGTARGTRQAATSSDDLFHSPLACTAVKLLYESVDVTCDVSRKTLQDSIESLTLNFFDDIGGGADDHERVDGE